MLDNLYKYKILLASKSPRRKELLGRLGLEFQVVSVDNIEEIYPENMKASDVAEYLSQLKADGYSDNLKDNEMIITADTVVICDDVVLGKPQNYDDALEMLMRLSGKVHSVSTGVTIMTKSKRTSFSVSTEVEFSEISSDEAKFYIDNYSPFDKAGAYGIQEWIGCVAVKGIRGSFYNVMGLPVHRLYQELKQF